MIQPLLMLPEYKQRYEDINVSPHHYEWILDQSENAAWKGTQAEVWGGNGLMMYPMRVLADRGTTSALLWAEQGLVPLGVLDTSPLERPVVKAGSGCHSECSGVCSLASAKAPAKTQAKTQAKTGSTSPTIGASALASEIQPSKEVTAAAAPLPPPAPLEKGSRVVIIGLAKAPQYNNEVASVLGYDGESGRYNVRLISSDASAKKKTKVVRVRRENLQPHA